MKASIAVLLLLAAAPAIAEDRLPPLPASPDQIYHGPPPPPCALRVIRETHTLPEYPFWSKILARQGWTVLRVTVGTDGVPTQAAVDQSSGTSGLDDTAVEHVQKVWRWRPQTDSACQQPQTIKVNIVWRQPGQPFPPRP